VSIGQAGEGAVSATDRYSTMLADLMRRVGNIERLGHVHPSSNWPHPAGTVVATIASSAPDGWLLLDGTAHTNADTLYPDLWAVAPAAWKSGTTLTLVDARGRTIIGAGAGTGLTSRTLGDLVGVESVTLTSAQSGVPAHTHTQAAHTHTMAQHSHTMSAHTHSETSHTHSLPSHTHSIDHDHPSGTTSSNGSHTHDVSGTTSGSGNHQHAAASGTSGFMFAMAAPSTFTLGNGGTLQAYATYGTVTEYAGTHDHGFAATSTSHAGHTHTFDVASYSGSSGSGGSGTSGSGSGGTTGSGGGGSTSTDGATTTGSGGGDTVATNTAADAASAHTNMQPSVALNWIVRT
jgi:microcystin-dependent protein